jgi:hypothetical protein
VFTVPDSEFADLVSGFDGACRCCCLTLIYFT